MKKDLSKGLRRSKKEKKEILFGTFDFRFGLNVTVRRGVHWYGTKGDYVAAPSDKKDKARQSIYISKTEIYKFKEIPAKVLYYEHQRDCQTYRGLLAAMLNAYGTEFNEEEYVTVITFMRTGGGVNETSNL